MEIAILLATYNGERYLTDQLDSLIAQSYADWHLYIHDDGSSDNTPVIIRQYQSLHTSRITILDYPPQGSAFANFMSLLQKVDADYYMFCDQDDIWHPRKIERSMQEMQEAEKETVARPVVIHTDLRVVGAEGSTLAPSFWQKAGMHPEMFKTCSQRISNVVTGCTMLFNHAARESALKRTPDGTPLHDEWVTIRACVEGGIVRPVFDQTIDYRQHSENTLGAEACYQQKTLAYYMTHIKRIWRENLDNYRMLRSAGYGSVSKYLYFKARHTLIYHLKY